MYIIINVIGDEKLLNFFACRYIKQFTEIITEEGRRSVKITHQIAGQPAVVTYTQTVPHFTPAQPQQNQPTDNPQALINHATQLAASIVSLKTKFCAPTTSTQ